MPDTGHQAPKPGPSARLGSPDPQADEVRKWYEESPSEGSSNKWSLVWTVIFASTFGVAAWSMLIYRVWGELL